jgi:K+-transporting ATPase ATPase C chain
MKTLAIAARATLLTLVITGVVYPLAVTALAQLLFSHRANGSLVADDKGRIVGSELIGQTFANPAYLHGRASANDYDAANSGGTNLAVTSKKLHDDAAKLDAGYRADNALAADAVIPADAITRSASGLDPDISPENAALQVARIAKARGVTVERVEAIVDGAASGRELGVLGEPYVRVLVVNLALDRSFGAPPNTLTIRP